MTITEMRELPAVELRSEITKTREKLWKLRFQARGEPVESPGALRKLKKDIARMMTVLREKASEAELAAAGEAAAVADDAGASEGGTK